VRGGGGLRGFEIGEKVEIILKLCNPAKILLKIAEKMQSMAKSRPAVSPNQPQTALSFAPAKETELARLMDVKEDKQNGSMSVVSLSQAATPAVVGEEGSQRQHSGVGQPNELLSLNGHQPEVVPADAALTALLEDASELEKSIAQLQQQKREALKRRVKEGMQHLEEQAERINALAEQLEEEILKFQEMAERVKVDLCAKNTADSQLMSYPALKRHIAKPDPICEVSDCAVPTVVRCGFKFVLASRKVEKLGVTEEDAAQRAAKAQQRREAFERWLESRRQRIVDGFSGL